MTTLANELQPYGTELPSAALVRLALAPVVCVASLGLCLVAFGEPLSLRYMFLAIGAILVSIQVFGEMPLPNGTSGGLIPRRVMLVDWVIVCGILLLLGFATKVSDLYSRKVLLTWFVVTPFALQVAQELARRLLPRFIRSSTTIRTRVIVGVTEKGLELAHRIAEDPCLGVVHGFFDDRAAERLPGARSGEVLGALANVAEYVKRNAINVVYITLPMSEHPRIVRLLDDLRDTTASIYFVPAGLPFDFIQARIDRIGNISVIAVCETPLYGIKGALKRASDLAIGSIGLLMAWPVMLLIAAGIKLTSPGPVLFKQRRYGMDGKEFLVSKFRTMIVAEDGERIVQAKRNDARVTPFGAFLRKTSLDELPQLFNVLAGTMSIVGPRPHAVAHNEQYRGLINGYMVRHKVRPGITGWAQINGLRGETQSIERMKERVEYDLDYLKHWSLSLDLWIVLRTALLVLKDSRAY